MTRSKETQESAPSQWMIRLTAVPASVTIALAETTVHCFIVSSIKRRNRGRSVSESHARWSYRSSAGHHVRYAWRQADLTIEMASSGNNLVSATANRLYARFEVGNTGNQTCSGICLKGSSTLDRAQWARLS